MKVVSADFIKSVYDTEQLPTDGRPEVAFLGRSNVGKSSLLNSLLQRRGLARTSNTPGRTQSINYFLVNKSFYFVDLPGYGFARVSKAMRADWGEMARRYLTDRAELKLSIQLIDARHEPTALDMQLHEWLVYTRKEHIAVATKADKLSRSHLDKQLKVIAREIRETRLMPYSSEVGTGRDEVWAEIETALKKR
ncbi:MAG: ribosome biogenesis GTP-binding protein YihA/YsxC [Acidobacteria bacterium]|nr:ribosome biogenesis GTP-binding protein YihA/YsxC [Acidobacteriota bacterium]